MHYDISRPETAFHSRRKCTKLTKDQKRQAELKCLEDPYYAHYLRREVKDIPEDIKRQLELKCLDDPYWAHKLRCEVKDLPEDIKRQAEQKCLVAPYWAFYVLKDARRIPKEVRVKLALKVMEDPECFWCLRWKFGKAKFYALMSECNVDFATVNKVLEEHEMFERHCATVCRKSSHT